MDAIDRRALADTEHLGDLGHRQALPVIELERDLLIERDPAQRIEQSLQCTIALDSRHGSGREVVQARDRGIDFVLPSESIVELVARDPVEERTRVLDDRALLARLEASEECALHEVRGIGRDLAREEVRDAIAVPPIERAPGRLVALGPRIDELTIRLHAKAMLTSRGGIDSATAVGCNRASADRGGGGSEAVRR